MRTPETIPRRIGGFGGPRRVRFRMSGRRSSWSFRFSATKRSTGAPGNTPQGATAMPFYEKGDVRIHYDDTGSGFPLMLIPGGGLNSNISFFTGSAPFNAIEELKGE